MRACRTVNNVGLNRGTTGVNVWTRQRKDRKRFVPVSIMVIAIVGSGTAEYVIFKIVAH